MKHSANLISSYVILSTCILCTFQIYSKRIHNEDRNGVDYTREESEETEEGLLGLIPTFRNGDTCITPNNEIAECVPIKECDILLNKVIKQDAKEFVRASHCKSPLEDRYNPKVCCGSYDDFKNTSASRKIIHRRKCGQQKVSTKRRILGGSEANMGEYPWMARLIYRDSSGIQSGGCAGFLVSSKFVVTAAHCTHPHHTRLKGPVKLVILGGHNVTAEKYCSFDGKSCPESVQVRGVIKVINHPEYRPISTNRSNDIAIIRIERTHRTDFIQPICLPSTDIQNPMRYYLSGWGLTENGLTSKVKMKLEIPSFDKESCKEKFISKKIKIGDTQICAGGESQKDSCGGDSGGPLMMVDDDETWFAVGIVSFGVECGKVGWPGVYTNTAKFLPWIKNELVENMISIKVNGRRTIKDSSSSRKLLIK